MSAPEFAVGEVVDIHIIGAKVMGTDDVGLMRVLVGNWQPIINLRNDGVAVERVAPAGWPPQAGDVWKDSNDEEWFASTRTATSPVELFLADFSSSMAMEPDDLAEKFGPVRLVRRREPVTEDREADRG